MFSVARAATYALRPSPHRFQIGVHVTHLWSFRKYGNQVGWGWTVCSVREQLDFRFSNRFNGRCCRIRSVVVMRNYPFCQHSSAFTANCGFKLLFKLSTIPCTILVVLEGEPIKVPKAASTSLYR
jgi:hypothetical protein